MARLLPEEHVESMRRMLKAVEPFDILADHAVLARPPRKTRSVFSPRARGVLRMALSRPDLLRTDAEHRILFSFGNRVNSDIWVREPLAVKGFIHRFVKAPLVRVLHYFSLRQARAETRREFESKLAQAVRAVHPDLRVSVDFGKVDAAGFAPVHMATLFSTTDAGRTFIGRARRALHFRRREVRGAAGRDFRLFGFLPDPFK